MNTDSSLTNNGLENNIKIETKFSGEFLASELQQIKNKIGALLNIVTNATYSLEDEIDLTKKAIDKKMDFAMLLSDTLNTMEYNKNDLEAFFAFMCSVQTDLQNKIKYLNKHF